MARINLSDISFNEAVMRLSAYHGARAGFRYTKDAPGNPVEDRTLDVEEVTVSQDGNVICTGTDPDRNGAPRAYRLDRIHGAIKVEV